VIDDQLFLQPQFGKHKRTLFQ